MAMSMDLTDMSITDTITIDGPGCHLPQSPQLSAKVNQGLFFHCLLQRIELLQRLSRAEVIRSNRAQQRKDGMLPSSACTILTRK